MLRLLVKNFVRARGWERQSTVGLVLNIYFPLAPLNLAIRSTPLNQHLYCSLVLVNSKLTPGVLFFFNRVFLLITSSMHDASVSDPHSTNQAA